MSSPGVMPISAVNSLVRCAWSEYPAIVAARVGGVPPAMSRCAPRPHDPPQGCITIAERGEHMPAQRAFRP